MEFFLIILFSFLLVPVILGWLLIGATLLLTPLMGGIYFFYILNTKLSHSEKSIVNDDTLLNQDTILIVDDQYPTVIPLIKILEQSQLPIKYVSDGFEAISELMLGASSKWATFC